MWVDVEMGDSSEMQEVESGSDLTHGHCNLFLGVVVIEHKAREHILVESLCEQVKEVVEVVCSNESLDVFVLTITKRFVLGDSVG